MSVHRWRVGIVGVNHESNTFIPERTTLEHFRASILLRGPEIAEKFRDAHHEVGGFLEVLAAEGIEPVPILLAHAMPWGPVEEHTLETLWAMAEEGLARAGKLDGVLAANHGAGVGVAHPDLDGWWLGRLRALVGPGMPLVGTIDPHANLTPAMTAACDALIAYRENPHLDQRQRGVEAARMLVATLRGEAVPAMAAAFPPLVINIERQLTAAAPMAGLHRELDRVRARPGVLSASVVMGFPYADVAEMGTSVIVVADGDSSLARREADGLASWILDRREDFRGRLITPEEAVRSIAALPGPVGLLDMGDNMGGGAPGDSTVLARLCREERVRDVFWYLPDPEAVQKAVTAGVGARVAFHLGGKLPLSPAAPLAVVAEVMGVHDGKYSESQPRHGGRTGGDMGTSVVLCGEDGCTILVTSRRAGPHASVAPIRAVGLEPASFRALIVRGVHAPVGGYAEVCPTLIRVNTPGVTTADLNALTYRNRRRPLFPFEQPD